MKNKETINYEYEERAMIDENTYHEMIAKYSNKNSKILKISNTYLNYSDLSLDAQKMMLRIRNIDNENKELTLKIKDINGDIELNYFLTSKEEEDILTQSKFPNSIVLEKLKELAVNISKLKPVVTLKTERIEIYHEDHVLVIDKNLYNRITDYNVEVESTSKNNAKSYLISYISPFGVTYKKGYVTKIKRALNSIK